MGIFDDLKATANAVGKMATDAVDISKLKITSAEIASEISEKYEDLGRTVYEAKKTGVSDNSILVNKIAQLDILIRQFHDTENQIAILKNKIKCNECGCDNDNKAVYCMKCGAKLKTAETKCSCSYTEVDCNEDSCSEDCSCETSENKEGSTEEKTEVCDCQETQDKCEDNCDCGCNDEKVDD